MSLEMFIMKCLKYDNSPDMFKIVENKVKKYYHACDAAYTSSETFKKLLQSRMKQMDKDPRNLHVYIKEIVDELKLRYRKDPPKKKIKLDPSSSDNSNQEKPTEEVKPVKEESHFQENAARKLSKLLHCLQKKIMKLEDKEVEWDDENDSSYVQLQRYKERAVAVYKKLQQYECGVIPKLQERRTVTYSGTAFPTVNRAIEKFVNKTGQFPDYQEVLKLLRSAYEDEKTDISPERLRLQAKAAFQTIGEQLQRQRQFSTWNTHSYFLGSNKDPAEDDRELDKKLRENQQEFGNRINEIINKYADQTKDVAPEEVADDETASKSDDEENDDSEEGTVDGSEGENNFVDEFLAGMSNDENGTSENEENSNESSDNSEGGEYLQTKETEYIDNSKHAENEDEVVEIREHTPDLDENSSLELFPGAERTESNKKCNLLQESKRELQECVLVSTNLVKVEAATEPHKSGIDQVAVSNSTPDSQPFKLQDSRHNGLIPKVEQFENYKSEVRSCESEQHESLLTKYSEVDNDSDNDVIILE